MPIRFTWPTNGHDLLARNYTGLIFFYITEHHRGAGHDPRQAPGQDPHHQATERKLGDDAASPVYIVNQRGVGYRMARPDDA